MSPTRHELVPQLPGPGDPESCEEYGYGLGDVGGILLLRYTSRTPLTFDAMRQDFLHHLWWSPDGPLIVSSASVGYRVLDRGAGLWVRRGTTHTVHVSGAQEVLRVCLRETPATLGDVRAAVVRVDTECADLLSDLARPGVETDVALRCRARVMALLESVDRARKSGVGPDGPAAEVARALYLDPADPTTLEQWAARHHVGVRTLQRAFVREFGTSWSRWRTQVRLELARALLPGRSVTEVAHRVGYSTPSAFVTAYVRQHGRTPGSETSTGRGHAGPERTETAQEDERRITRNDGGCW